MDGRPRPEPSQGGVLNRRLARGSGRPPRRGALLLAAAALFAPAVVATDAAAQETARAALAWEAAFQRRAGWTGADACYSVDLEDGRTLWLFGDTWIGDVKDGARAAGSTLVNNSVAVHRTPAPGQAPEAVAFSWGEGAERPRAWIEPERGKGWFWPQDACVASGRLLLFLVRVGRTEAGGPWGFELLGSTLAVVDDPSGALETWTVRQVPLPFARGAEQATPQQPLTTWGAGVLLEGGWLYVYGIRERSPKELLLARVQPAQVTDPSAWRFWTGEGEGEGWTADADHVSPVARGLANELSVDALRGAGRDGLVMVHSEHALGTRILVRTADRPQGPWSEPVAVHDVRPELDAETFTYAAKAHPHLSPEGELLVSYVVNAQGLERLVRDLSIYRPRFLWVDLDAVLPRAR